MSESNDSNLLHMVQLCLDPRRLAGLGKRLGLFKGRNGRQQVSTNYLVHCALGELFQDQAPKPFHVQPAQRRVDQQRRSHRDVRVLGYGSAPSDALQQRAQMSAPPAVYDGCNWNALATKEMPPSFPDGLRLRFELRACPVVRKSSAGEGENREADRPVHTVKKPDVTLTGTLTVTDGAAFTDLLRSGIGRHKSFGYGMLKVRRA
jgi:CRISPR system Cascade subunit CasE